MKLEWWVEKAARDLERSNAQIDWGEYDDFSDRELRQSVIRATQDIVVSKVFLQSITATLVAIKQALYLIVATLLGWLVYEMFL